MDNRIKMLLYAAKSYDAVMSRIAISELGALKDPTLVKPLLEIVNATGFEGKRREAVMALVKIGKPAVQPILAHLLELLNKHDELEEEDIAWALIALGLIGDRSAIHPLLRHWKKFPDYSTSILVGLALIDEVEMLNALMERLESEERPDYEFFSDVARGFRILGDPAIAALKENMQSPKIGPRCKEVLKIIGNSM